ncbi:DUF732 domain-containing protein [Mycolicibacterium anyangense]|uniref:DUF732 domain-containing protein n=1 Tax=Mycolicibacterium anyangense TaxID=1431246 RepID=UPI0013D28CD6|nr:DUF732 domain-containing protein [Mycolicibacterium anyangense]
MRSWKVLLTVPVVSMLLAAPAAADPDTDFAAELHTYGIYGQRDYNAWIGKITCKRADRGIDKDANASAVFVHNNLAPGTTTEQAWQFLAAAVRTYCPEQFARITDAAR